VVAQSRSLGWGPTLLLIAATPVVTLGGLWLLLRFDAQRKAERLPEGREWRADAIAYGEDLAAFVTGGVSSRIAPHTQVVGWLDVERDGFAWCPRPRFQRRGAPRVAAQWDRVREVSTAEESSPTVRKLVRVDVIGFALDDERSLAVHVTNPRPVYEAFRRLGIATVAEAI
jgi:hypothetical protein